MNISLDYTPNKGQSEFHASSSIYRAMVGALGSGKTATLCMEAFLLSTEYPGNVGLIARKSLPELQMTTQKVFFNYVPKPLIVDWNQTKRELWIKTKGTQPSLIHFGPLDELDRYKSLELGWFAVDEASEITEEMWLTLCGRLRIKHARLSGMIATNPTTIHHWIYKRFVAKPTQGYEIFRSKTADNKDHLPPGYIEQLVSNYPEDWRKRYLEGEFGMIQEGDPVFPDFKMDVHVRPVKFMKGRPIIRCWDFGYHHPFCGFAQIDELGRFKILPGAILGNDEDLDDVFCPRIIRISNDKWLGESFEDFCDIAGVQRKDTAKSAVQILNEHRIYPKYRYFKVEERNMELRKLMRQTIQGEPAFQIDPDNAYLIEGFLGGYCYGKKMDGVMTEEPKKDGYFDHGMDGIGYAVANKFMNANPTRQEMDGIIEEPKWRMNPHSSATEAFFGRRA